MEFFENSAPRGSFTKYSNMKFGIQLKDPQTMSQEAVPKKTQAHFGLKLTFQGHFAPKEEQVILDHVYSTDC